MISYTILICDDKEAVHESLAFFLRKEGMGVLAAFDGASALRLFSQHQVDLLVLDVMLPDMSGMEICQRVKRERDVPVLFLSACTEEEDRISGLEIGGDDYVTKPYSPREVALRIRKLLQRHTPSSGRAAEDIDQRVLEFEELRLDPATMEVYVNDEKIDLTGREVQFLAYMMENVNRVLNREQILAAVWGYDYYGETRTVDATVKRLRKKLPSEDVHFSIQSIYGVGYRLGRSE